MPPILLRDQRVSGSIRTERKYLGQNPLLRLVAVLSVHLHHVITIVTVIMNDGDQKPVYCFFFFFAENQLIVAAAFLLQREFSYSVCPRTTVSCEGDPPFHSTIMCLYPTDFLCLC